MNRPGAGIGVAAAVDGIGEAQFLPQAQEQAGGGAAADDEIGQHHGIPPLVPGGDAPPAKLKADLLEILGTQGEGGGEGGRVGGGTAGPAGQSGQAALQDVHQGGLVEGAGGDHHHPFGGVLLPHIAQKVGGSQGGDA